jgi:NAD(P)-dependent dehydrogenase (short-subunit alcohol dehydrogenase family)
LLDAKTAIVTGAGSGVGRGIALALASEGANLVAAGRTERKLADTCDEIRRRGGKATAVRCDVTNLDDIENCLKCTMDTYGGLDILVNNAVQYDCLGFMLDVSDDAAETGWQSGPLAALRFMRLAHPYLKGHGSIVNLGAGSALSPDKIARRGVYSAIKEAIRVLSRAAAVEWGPEGIRVNCIMPYAWSPQVKAFFDRDPVWFEEHVKETPLRRVGDAESDIGRSVVFLVGPDASYITGTTLMIDGGQQYLR